MSMGSKLRMGLAALMAAALVGSVLAAGPVDAGKKKHHKNVKVHKGSSVEQVSKGGDATAGNGGNGGAGGSSGNFNNTGSVSGVAGPSELPGPGAGLPAEFIGCVTGIGQVLNGVDIVTLDTLFFCEAGLPFPGLDVFPAFTECLGPPSGAEIPFWTLETITACLAPTVPVPGGGVFSGNGGNGATGGNGGNAVGGNGGTNMNTNTRTVTSDDHSIDVG